MMSKKDKKNDPVLDPQLVPDFWDNSSEEILQDYAKENLGCTIDDYLDLTYDVASTLGPLDSGPQIFFRLGKDGKLQDWEKVKSSKSIEFEEVATNAFLLASASFPPLPDGAPSPCEFLVGFSRSGLNVNTYINGSEEEEFDFFWAVRKQVGNYALSWFQPRSRERFKGMYNVRFRREEAIAEPVGAKVKDQDDLTARIIAGLSAITRPRNMPNEIRFLLTFDGALSGNLFYYRRMRRNTASDFALGERSNRRHLLWHFEDIKREIRGLEEQLLQRPEDQKLIGEIIRVAGSANDLPLILKYCNELIKTAPNAYLGYWRLAMKLENYARENGCYEDHAAEILKAAHTALRKSAERKDKDMMWVVIASVLGVTASYEQAVDAYNNIVDKDELNRAHYKVAKACELRGDWQNAIKELRFCLARHADDEISDQRDLISRQIEQIQNKALMSD